MLIWRRNFWLGSLKPRPFFCKYHTLPASIVISRLLERNLPVVYDYLSPQPSHLLDVSLLGFVPDDEFGHACHDDSLKPLRSIKNPKYMPPGHHLVYFPTPVPSNELLVDGTDTLHYPGPPFNRRMWAGGSIRFCGPGGPLLNGQRAACVEGIRSVTTKGPEGSQEEKILVDVERRISNVGEEEPECNIRRRVWAEDETQTGDAVILERRHLVFMRDRNEESPTNKDSLTNKRRLEKLVLKPEFSHSIVPTQMLLFRFSALTFNAHLIHLDPGYAKNVEGYRDLLVHGPLTLALMLTTVRKIIGAGRAIESIYYRNLMPIPVDSQMIICGRRKSKNIDDTWDVWVEGPKGGIAAKSVIRTSALT